MTEQEEKNIRSYCAMLLKDYGIQLSPNDPVIPALYIIHQEMKFNKQGNEAIAQAIKIAATKVQPKVYQFNVPGEAWKFQLAIATKWILIGLSTVLACWSIAWYGALKGDVKKANEILRATRSLEGLVKHVNKDSNGSYYIDVFQGKSDSVQNFTEYKRMTPKSIRVYLGTDEKY